MVEARSGGGVGNSTDGTTRSSIRTGTALAGHGNIIMEDVAIHAIVAEHITQKISHAMVVSFV